MTVKNSRKELTFVIIALFVCTSITPALAALNQKKQYDLNVADTNSQTLPENVVVTCYTFGYPGKTQRQITMSRAEAEAFNNKLKEAQIDLACDPFSEQSQQAQQEIISLAHDYNLISDGFSLKSIPSPLLSTIPSQQKIPSLLPFGSKATERICTFVTTGSGAALPIIILPRFIPFLLTPIPRVFVGWNAREGITSCGGLLSGTGFIAYGPQKGLALGFWGIGLTFSLPPVMNTYGLIGYALYATVEADYIERYPPNNPPVVSGMDPGDGEINVPLSLSELRFRIEDADADLMSYAVTTTPDIGSGQGNLKTDGVYSIPISNLQSKTLYTWHIDVTDGEDTSVYDFSFTTEPVEPIISNPIPTDGEKEVFTDITQLQFTLKDFQGDPMDYTVQTSPDIGSASATHVPDGTYVVPVSGLEVGTSYRWFVNVTDGTHWTRETLSFETGYPSQFNPFDYGWQYRKQITINHAQVAGDLTNFPVLISTTDADLKARADGGDFLFMNNAGVASKLHHDIDLFDQSTRNLVAWVKVPLLSSTNDTVIYLYYGNPSSLTMAYPEKVWTGFKAVYHLSQTPPGKVQDSTGNNNNGDVKGAMTSSDLVDGKVGSGYSFDGADDFISFADFTSSMNKGTCSAWVQTVGDTPMMVWGEGNLDGYKPYMILGKGDGGELLYARDVYGTDSNYQGRKEIGMNDGTWHYVVWLSTGSTNQFFFDGQEVSMNWQDGQNPNGIWFDDQSTDTTSIGCRNSVNTDNLWDGLLDEIRITDVPLHTSWIATEYANQNNPSGFVSFGPEEPGP
jgi:hypothetical protein